MIQNMKKLREACICRRWAQNACESIVSRPMSLNFSPEMTPCSRFNLLSKFVLIECVTTRHTVMKDIRINDLIHRETERMKALWLPSDGGEKGETLRARDKTIFGVKDP